MLDGPIVLDGVRFSPQQVRYLCYDLQYLNGKATRRWVRSDFICRWNPGLRLLPEQSEAVLERLRELGYIERQLRDFHGEWFYFYGLTPQGRLLGTRIDGPRIDGQSGTGQVGPDSRRPTVRRRRKRV